MKSILVQPFPIGLVKKNFAFPLVNPQGSNDINKKKMCFPFSGPNASIPDVMEKKAIPAEESDDEEEAMEAIEKNPTYRGCTIIDSGCSCSAPP